MKNNTIANRLVLPAIVLIAAMAGPVNAAPKSPDKAAPKAPQSLVSNVTAKSTSAAGLMEISRKPNAMEMKNRGSGLRSFGCRTLQNLMNYNTGTYTKGINLNCSQFK